MAKKTSEFKTIEEMQKAKADWVAQTKRLNNFNGIKNTLVKLYTSSGHFIFELLLNAEDVNATSVSFKLDKEKLIFEHNGSRPFDINDIDSITNIGDSTKEDNGNSIGKFGIGFKSVFEYTASPEIHSGDYHFEINDLFVPSIIQSIDNYDSTKTIIILPFNGDKDSNTCYEEIKKSLSQLKSNVLLFLQSISEINCKFDMTEITITRIDPYEESDCPENVCKIQRNVIDNSTSVKEMKHVFYKRFFKEIVILNEENKEKQISIGIAFKVSHEDNKWSITPIFKSKSNVPGGKVFAYFPCKKEDSKLCFHIHAPFALTVTRESLQEDNQANKKVIEEIGSLLCDSMQALKKEGFVNLDLYKTLPNEKDDDDLGKYLIIRSKIENLFLNHPYILMADGSYQEPRNKFMGSRQFQDLISDEDLSSLFFVEKRSFWIKNPHQKFQRDYNFLQSLKIREYTIAEFLNNFYSFSQDKEDAFKLFLNRLETRGATWFTKLYSLMSQSWISIENTPVYYNRYELPLCYCDDNKVYPFEDCFLSNDIKLDNYSIHCVNPDCFKKSLTETNIRNFLQYNLGIQEFGLNDFVKVLCSNFNNKTEKKVEDIKPFFELYKKDNSITETLKKFRILKSEDGKWAIPENFYIPEEIDDTVKNISIYFDFYNKKTQGPIYKLSPDYRKLFDNEDNLKKFYFFLRRLGCKSNIPVDDAYCWDNPNWNDIVRNFPRSTLNAGNRNYTSIDYTIKYFDEFLARPANEAIFELINSALNEFNDNWIKCIYTPAQKRDPVKYPSQITCSLKNAKWFIQEDDNGKAYFVKPEDAIKSRIPKKYEISMLSKKLNLWLREMNFGVQEEIKNEQYEKENDIISSVVGLDDNSIGILRQFNKSDLSSEIKEEILNNINQYLQSCLSESMYRENDFDINRLNEKSEEAYNNANDMEYEDRKRSVRIIDPEKALAEPFLRQVCVNEDGEILCQICRNHLPFKKQNGQEYFEKIQLFPKSLIKKELKVNYIACCPVCAAKMKVYYSHNVEAQKTLFKQISYSQESIVTFPVQLDKDSDITFAKRHIVALRKMIELSQKE